MKIYQKCSVAFSGLVALLLVFIACCNALAQFNGGGCYTLTPASVLGNRITNVNGVLKMQSANNSEAQLFYINGQAGSSGTVSILAQGTNQGFLSTVDRNVGTPINFMKAADFPPAGPNSSGYESPKWQLLPVNDGSTDSRYNITRYHNNNYQYPVVGFGASNWGNGSSGTTTDINLVSASDLNVYGANKWYLTKTSCPASYCNFQINLTASNYNPIVGTTVILNSNCTGNCEGVYYTWNPSHYSGYGTIFTPYAAPNGQLGPFPVSVSATKPGCPTQYQGFDLNVISGQTSYSNCKEAEGSIGTGPVTSDPNASNGQTRGAESNYNHYVQYEIDGVPATGTYNVTLRYYSSSAPSVNVSVSQSGFSQNFNLPNSGSWNIAWTEQTFPVNLQYGNNVIKISGIGGGSCRQDKICVNSTTGVRMGADEVISQGETSREWQVFPNPSKGEFEVEFYLEKGEPADLTVTSIAGQTLQKRSVVGKGIHREKFDVGGSVSGMYLFNVIKRDKKEVKKIFINR
jgi:hypothetical protein